MKRFSFLLLLGICSISVVLGVDHPTQNGAIGYYYGPVKSVSVGFWGEIAVFLPDGETCNGVPYVLLVCAPFSASGPAVNPYAKEIFSLLVAAVSTGQNVHLRLLGTTPNGAGTISEANLGDPIWAWPKS